MFCDLIFLEDFILRCPLWLRERMAATRSCRFLLQIFIRRTNVILTAKPSNEALNRQFIVGAVNGCTYLDFCLLFDLPMESICLRIISNCLFSTEYSNVLNFVESICSRILFNWFFSIFISPLF